MTAATKRGWPKGKPRKKQISTRQFTDPNYGRKIVDPTAGLDEHQKAEWLKCSMSPLYFIVNYCHIYDSKAKDWILFRLWADQIGVLNNLQTHLLLVILKARQLGLTWEILCYYLWCMLFQPTCVVLIFSRRDTDAVYLLSDRLKKGVYNRLPEWLQTRELEKDSEHVWKLSNGSEARAFPTTAGDSYTATHVLIDEADLIPDLDKLLSAVKPTTDNGGQVVLLSRSDKNKPKSPFKTTYREAKAGKNSWKSVFLPWYSHQGRDEAWYSAQKQDILSRHGSLDTLWEQYPATDEEALAPRTASKRIPSHHLRKIYAPVPPYVVGEHPSIPGVPQIPGLRIYRAPSPSRRYVLGADVAEGNPTSTESAIVVIDVYSGETVAVLAHRVEPAVHAHCIQQLCAFYLGAAALIERNNHGHVVIQWLQDHAREVFLLSGDTDSKRPKPGQLTTSSGKARMYSTGAEVIGEEDSAILDEAIFLQVQSVEGATLKAPPGELDDLSMAYMIGLLARRMSLTENTWSGAGW